MEERYPRNITVPMIGGVLLKTKFTGAVSYVINVTEYGNLLSNREGEKDIEGKIQTLYGKYTVPH